MPLPVVGTISSTSPTTLSLGMRYRVYLPSGGGTLNPAYQAIGACQLMLKLRIPTQSTPYVVRLLGPGDTIVLDGDIYSTVEMQTLQVPSAPASAITRFTYSTAPAQPYLEPILDMDVVEVTRPHKSAAMLSMISTTTPTGGWNQTDTWTVPNGQRWRVRAAYVFEYISTSTGSNVDVVFTRSPFTIAEITTTLSSTGTQTAAGNYVAQSDETGNYNATGGNSVLMRPGGVVLHPGDILAVYVDSPNAGDTVIVSVIMEVEADG